MPRVTHVKKSRTKRGTCYRCGKQIEEGDSYFWAKLKLARGGIRREFCSDHYPKTQELSNSEWTCRLADFTDALGAADDIDAIREVAEEVREFGEEQQEKFDCLPENFQYSATGELLEERAQACESAADELESACDDFESEFIEDEPEDCEKSDWAAEFEGDDDAPDYEEWKQEKLDEYEQEKQDKLDEIKGNFEICC